MLNILTAFKGRIKRLNLLTAIKYDIERFDTENEFFKKYMMNDEDFESALDWGDIKEMGTFQDDKNILELIKKRVEFDGIIDEFLNADSDLDNEELICSFIGDSEFFHIFTIGNDLYFSDCYKQVTDNL